MVRLALDVPDALASQLLLEDRLAAPGGVLASIVGQDFLWRAEGGDAPLDCLEDQRAALLVGDRVADDEAGVIVHERGQVDPLMASQQEREDVGLPELVRLRALEAVGRGRRALVDGRCRGEQPLLVKDATHDVLGDPDALEAGEQVLDAASAVMRVGGALGHHGLYD